MKILTNLDLSQNEIQNAIMQPLAAPPANPKLGQIYFSSVDLTLYLWTGEKWIPVPTKLSQLENDSKFITAKDVPEGATASTTTPKMNGAAGGVAELDSGGKVPANQLPSYVDDVVDAYIRTGATALGADWLSKTSGGAALTPESDKIYVILSEGEYQNKTYRWSGTTYAVIGNDLALGETASTAYRGDRGKTAYDHSQSAHAPADAEKNVQSDWNETDGNSDAFIKNKPAIPKAVTKTVQTLSDAASKSFTVTGYILSVILIDSVTKEQVIGDVSFENATASANGKVTVTLSAAPSNPILVIITSIAL